MHPYFLALECQLIITIMWSRSISSSMAHVKYDSDKIKGYLVMLSWCHDTQALLTASGLEGCHILALGVVLEGATIYPTLSLYFSIIFRCTDQSTL